VLPTGSTSIVPERILTGRAVLTVDPANPVAQAVAIAGDRGWT